ncbi:hypothetical protein [Couchioplanes azureus]|uniref:hypothetical protein n=1 Tax=Couchioplanes caeruleus TaxID=56438 RepID=UPI00166F90C2|nr:hypothetical protein [Couchioplanes caeruleus]GGQ82931.1 hypothetical protein GCM10010166_61390 [Couchioplanes caeruleus subsp. azureus]
MKRYRVGRRAVGAVVAAVAGLVGSVVVTTAPGRAVSAPVRPTASSPYDTDETKEVSVSCPGAYRVFAVGYRIIDGRGSVTVTRMQPDAGLTSARIEARARTGHAEPWAVEAAVVCNVSAHAPVLVPAVVRGAAAVTAQCPGITRLLGMGYRYEGAADSGHVTNLTPDAGLTGVEVRTGGLPPQALTAYAICHEPPRSDGPPSVRVAATTGLSEADPTAVTAGLTGHSVYSVGVEVRGAPNAYPEAIFPDPDGGVGQVKVVRARLPEPAGGVERARRGAPARAGDDASTTVYVIAAAAFH